MVIIPPYFGVPRLSHQFPVAAVVVELVVPVLVVVPAVVFVVEVTVVLVIVVVVVDVAVFVVQDASSKAATSNKLKPNQIDLLFIYSCSY
jgi:nitrate/nitrite transporter NarK